MIKVPCYMPGLVCFRWCWRDWPSYPGGYCWRGFCAARPARAYRRPSRI